MKPLLIVGPSGVGKSYLLNLLVEQGNFKTVLSTMTRAPRFGEKHMVDNEYVSHVEYEKIVKSGDFFMNNEFFGEKYGSRRSFVDEIKKAGKIPTMIILSQLVPQFIQEYSDSIAIFLAPKDLELLRLRMQKRGDSSESIEKRLKSAQEEIAAYEKFKHLFKYKFEIEKDEDVYGILEEILEIEFK